MRLRLYYLIPIFSLVILFGFRSMAMADDWDLRTTFTISQPIMVPGQHVVLPAGSYVIKRVSTTGSVVQITNESETKVYATLLPTLDAVASPSDKPAISFEETPDGLMGLKTWYYPGRSTAFDFISEK
jgi:hypothetical protein